jgi:hypothetical protein
MIKKDESNVCFIEIQFIFVTQKSILILMDSIKINNKSLVKNH